MPLMCKSHLSYMADTVRGHFNPKEDPAEKEKLRLDMLARERARQKKANDAVKLYEDTRAKQVQPPLH